MRGATVIPSTRSPAISAFQPTRPLRGATRTSKTWKPATGISTHAPLAGRDRDMTPEEIAELISTHAPLAGRDNYATGMTANSIRFQPTRPLRGATPRPRHGCAGSMLFQPTRPLRGATIQRLHSQRAIYISTHAPLAGRDDLVPPFICEGGISTHAPLAGRDQALHPRKTHTGYFNPRAPCGARLRMDLHDRLIQEFQPTRPLRGATRRREDRELRRADISTHAPLAGRDSVS